MELYRKKPVVIQAEELKEPIEIETLEGTMRGEIGDFLIIGVNGEKYPCKPDIFHKTYTKVSDQNDSLEDYKNDLIDDLGSVLVGAEDRIYEFNEIKNKKIRLNAVQTKHAQENATATIRGLESLRSDIRRKQAKIIKLVTEICLLNPLI